LALFRAKLLIVGYTPPLWRKASIRVWHTLNRTTMTET
jgi:hypothetical protein